MSIYLGNIEPKKYFVGDKEAKSVWIGGTKVYGKESPAPKYNDDIVLLNDFANEPYGYTHTSGQNLKKYFNKPYNISFDYKKAGWEGVPCILNSDYTSDLIWDNANLRNLILNNDFTIEFWTLKKSSGSGNTGLFSFGKNGNDFWDLAFSIADVANYCYSWNNDSFVNNYSVNGIVYSFFHFAICKNSSNVYFFINGDKVDSITRKNVESSKTSNVFIPKWVSGKTEFYIAQICVRNVCKWTSGFDVPTIPYCISERKE